MLDELKEAAQEGPIVIIVTDISSDAIIVSESEIRDIPLTNMVPASAPVWLKEKFLGTSAELTSVKKKQQRYRRRRGGNGRP